MIQKMKSPISFYAQIPILIGYGYALDIKSRLFGESFPTSTHKSKEIEQMKEAIGRSVKDGAFYFKEVSMLKKAEKEQAALDYHLLKMETENPSERFVNSENFYSSKNVVEHAIKLYGLVKLFDPKQELSLKTLLNAGFRVDNEIFISWAAKPFK